MVHPIRAILDIIGEATGATVSHPLRTFLSIAAVSTAVATIAIVVTGLEGFQSFAKATSARAFGSDTFILAQVISSQLNRKELALKLERNPAVKRNDVRFLQNYAGKDVILSPIAQRRADVVAGEKKYEGAALNGVGSTMFDIRNIGLAAGRFFRENESRSASQVAVIGSDIAETLFPGQNPLNKKIRIGGRGFRIIGVQTRQGTSGGVSLDLYVWIPLRAFERVFGASESLQVFAKAAAIESTVEAEDKVRVIMRARRHLRPGEDSNFDILSPEAARSFVLNVSERIGAAAGPISLAALLAAIVVITNTSLVSVTQRTREIGIRRAIGAARSRIMAEVLTESILVALMGGAVGVLAAQALLSAGEALLGFALPLRLTTIGWSLFAAASSGLLAGLYPARRAARIEVINALRVE
ncbi:MAG: ABC transporter permease [Acidobacteriota bacterium]|nr:MAG: ABC transporter permease [Acidobacteriota bacterium]